MIDIKQMIDNAWIGGMIVLSGMLLFIFLISYPSIRNPKKSHHKKK